jgi:hypothetical protein
MERQPAKKRRHQVRERGGQSGQARVLLGRLAGEAVDDVPVDLDAVLGAPLEQPHVLQGGDTLAHQLQDWRAEALDARLQEVDAGLAQEPDLLAAEVGLRLVVEAQVVAALPQPGQDVAEVPHVQDGVDQREIDPLVMPGQRGQLLDDPIVALAAEGHGGAVEPAEGAV